MSTQSAIIMKTKTGFKGIYCHNDGYPEGVGATLQKYYLDPNKIAALIDLGSISSLKERVDPIGPHSFDRPEKGTTVAYKRDRGEDDEATASFEAETLEEIAADNDYDYVYLFAHGVWTVNSEILAGVCPNPRRD